MPCATWDLPALHRTQHRSSRSSVMSSQRNSGNTPWKLGNPRHLVCKKIKDFRTLHDARKKNCVQLSARVIALHAERRHRQRVWASSCASKQTHEIGAAAANASPAAIAEPSERGCGCDRQGRAWVAESGLKYVQPCSVRGSAWMSLTPHEYGSVAVRCSPREALVSCHALRLF